ncbi:MAG TPA: mechanosensitive ion channel family protein [Promineifilum sp.]|nr:mechanosensitive ion channel family protein [Promineifilum sp.]
MKARRILFWLLSPIWLALAAISLTVGLAFSSGNNPAATLVAEFFDGTPVELQMATLVVRLLLLPFQLIFIGLVIAAALWIFRRRDRLARWVLGEPLTRRLATADVTAGDLPAVLQPTRRRTVRQILSSLIALAAIFLGTLLAVGQFVARDDLALVVAALTSSLAWGARLPIGDLLGGITNIFETNLVVGDRILYKLFEKTVEGSVESVDLRYLSVRARSGELTSIPFGDLRIFRNYSRGNFIGVYAAFPVAAQDLRRAVALLTDLAPESIALVPQLLEPWQPMGLEGILGATVDIFLFGKTNQEWQDELQLAMHAVVHERFEAAGIPLRGKDNNPT